MSVTLRKRALLVLVVSLSILYSCSRETTKSISGKVVKIADGDTLTILDAQKIQHRIRLQGIDAPEHRQDFGEVSREHLSDLVFGKYVKIDYEKVDQYGRLVGKVWIDGSDECLEQLRAGLAWHYKEYEREQPPDDRQLYASAEQDARLQKRGLWRDPNPTPPWEYRHHKTASFSETESQDDPALDGRGHGDTSGSADRTLTSTPTPAGPARYPQAIDSIRGNKRTRIYHWPGCENYDDIALHNRVPFKNREEAEKAGYRAARNCH